MKGNLRGKKKVIARPLAPYISLLTLLLLPSSFFRLPLAALLLPFFTFNFSYSNPSPPNSNVSIPLATDSNAVTEVVGTLTGGGGDTKEYAPSTRLVPLLLAREDELLAVREGVVGPVAGRRRLLLLPGREELVLWYLLR